MTRCYYCDTEIEYLPFSCNFCGMRFCQKHRIPEKHDCRFDLKQNSQKTNILYQDALDFMNNEITVAKIYEYVEDTKMNEQEATEFLNYVIENSDDLEARTNSILAFKALELKNNRVFNILEKCLISDENPVVRHMAAKILSYNFPIKSKAPLKWAIEHDKDLNENF